MTHVLYIPGLGDAYDGFRAVGIKFWRAWGVQATLVPITWFDGADMASKMARIERAIDRVPNGQRIVLVGESAGATLALHASSHERVARVITLCGVARPSTPIAPQLRKRAPALDQAVRALPEDFPVEVHSVRAALDTVVGPRYSSTRDAKRHRLWTVGHMSTIALCLTVLAPIITTIAKKQ